MKYILLTSALFLTGCSVRDPGATIFLKEDNSRLYNLKDETCVVSGYQLFQLENKDYDLVVYYSNCEVHKSHVLNETEIKQWVPPKPIKSKLGDK